MEPAKTIIKNCGGFAAVAEITKRNLAQVYRWTYAREKGGTGGLIPADVQQTLMNAARERGLSLAPADFFPAEGGAVHAQSRGRDLRVTQGAAASKSAARVRGAA